MTKFRTQALGCEILVEFVSRINCLDCLVANLNIKRTICLEQIIIFENRAEQTKTEKKVLIFYVFFFVYKNYKLAANQRIVIYFFLLYDVFSTPFLLLFYKIIGQIPCRYFELF